MADSSTAFNIAAVSQETFLFSETIRENIALGSLGTDGNGDSIEECARIAQVGGEGRR